MNDASTTREFRTPAATGLLLAVLLWAGSAFSLPAQRDAGVDPGEIQARANALQLAQAFQPERFIARDTCRNLKLAPGESRLLRLNLLVALDYWFCLGWVAESDDTSLNFQLYEENGQPVVPEGISQTPRAVGFKITTAFSGPRFVKIINNGREPVNACLVYCYR